MTPEIILGPPGTGKTSALLTIVEELLASGYAPEEIGLVSFTRRAAEEAITRAATKFNLDRGRFSNIRTLHSLCFRGLGMATGDILQGKSLREFADWIGVRLTTWKGLKEGQMLGQELGDRILYIENLARVQCRPLLDVYNETNDDIPWSEVRRVTEGLKIYKARKGLMDYTDLLSQWIEAGIPPKIRVLLNDEGQDMSLLQWQVVAKLGAKCERIIIAGDDDQSIFAWAGAALEHFVSMPGQVRVLGHSWRVPRKVQDLALEIVNTIRLRRAKVWSAKDAEGVVLRAGGLTEVDLGGDDLLILARNTYVLQDEVIPTLRREGIVYEYKGESSINPEISEAIQVWERLRRGETVKGAEVKICMQWVRDLTERKRWRAVADDQMVTPAEIGPRLGEIWHVALDKLPSDEMSYLMAAGRRGEGFKRKPRVRLSTIHSAKGAEARHVVLMTEMAPRTAREAEAHPDDEARVWYVGVTRAAEQLTIVGTQARYYYPV